MEFDPALEEEHGKGYEGENYNYNYNNDNDKGKGKGNDLIINSNKEAMTALKSKKNIKLYEN